MSKWLAAAKALSSSEAEIQATDKSDKSDNSPSQQGKVKKVSFVTPPKQALKAKSADLSDYEERAAILQFDGNLSKDEAEARAAREQGFSDPASLHAAKIAEWIDLLKQKLEGEADPHGQKHIKTAIRFCKDGWAAQALAFGWTELELFGLCPRTPWARLDRQGAAFAGHCAAAVTAEAITFDNGLKRYRTQSDGAALA